MKPFAKLTPRMISNFCILRLAPVMSARETEAIRLYLIDLLSAGQFPPYHNRGIDCGLIGLATGLDVEGLFEARKHLQPVFDALCRAIGDSRSKSRTNHVKGETLQKPTKTRKAKTPKVAPTETSEAKPRKKSGYAPKPVVEFPDSKMADIEDIGQFHTALAFQMDRHGDSVYYLCRAISDDALKLDSHALRKWLSGMTVPHTLTSFEALRRIEHRYRLPVGYFRSRFPQQNRAAWGHILDDVSPTERRRLAWHLPDDFARRDQREQEEILTWVRSVIIHGSTDYRRYQAAAMKQRYAVRFRSIQGGRPTSPGLAVKEDLSDVDSEVLSGTVDAPAPLEKEMQALLKFKTSTLTAFGFQRNGVWGQETAAQKVEHLGLMFGALVASPRSAVRGFGAELSSLNFALLMFPAVWDWYLQWRQQRRGFYTNWEVDMLSIVLSMVRQDTGWLRQAPKLAERLVPIPGLVSQDDITEAKADWDAACDLMYKHGRHRIKEIQRVSRIHRDPFEPILPVLEADSPVGEYRKITEEILRLMPDERRYPRSAAEAVRAFLMLRLGLHLGLRQKNMRQLRVCPRDQVPTTERSLEDMKCGELRWSTRDLGWEVLIPSIAFKNATSSFFGSKPFRLVLPNLGGLYDMIEAYIDRHRAVLIGDAEDPKTFFVKTTKRTSADAAYNQNTFYEAWRLAIQRYGIYNPYTGRGVIKGLLPHGPHNIRDVLATHILKQTGSYEQASYAIQDTPEMVAQHYGRFLPQDKSALAAQILNRVWEAA